MPDRLATLLDPANTTLNGIDFVEITSADQTIAAGALPQHRHRAGHALAHEPGHHHRRRVDADRARLPDRRHRLGRRRRRPAHPGPAHPVPRRLLPLLAAHREQRPRSLLRRRAFHLQSRLPLHPRLRRPPSRARTRPAAAPSIDYLAKDFASFRAALLDYSALAYPAWVERDEPDLGIMLLELLSAAGDDLSYLQDRIASEATLATATQRSSVDPPRPPRRLRAAPGNLGAGADADRRHHRDHPAVGIAMEAPLPDGGSLSFELGDGLIDPRTGRAD